MKPILPLFLFISLNTFAQNKQVSLFNGKNFKGWHIDVPAMDSLPSANPFIIRNGYLVSLAKPEGHIITDKSYKNYELEVQYRFPAEPGNCGVLVHCSTPRILYKMFPKSIEVQLMHDHEGDFWCIGANIEVPDMEKRRGLKENWGIIEGKERQIKALKNAEKPLGEWNTIIVQCLKDRVKVWINGQYVNEGFNSTVQSGQIALQAEGSEMEFRKIALRSITKLSK